MLRLMQRVVIRPLIIALSLSFYSCSDMKVYHYQPVNPPVGVEMTKLGSGDYLLTFYSENRSNIRFGGFMIFIDLSQDALLDMTLISEAAYTPEGKVNNIGIDTPAGILFSDEENYDSVINDVTITERLPKDDLSPGSWLAVRAYLNDDSGEVLEVSIMGNSVFIEP